MEAKKIQPTRKNRLLGCFYGVAIGDALGAPFEFIHAEPKLKYDGLLVKVPVIVPFRFHNMIIKPSYPTDDTEMTMALLDSILKSKDHKTYSRDVAITSYLKWANQKETPMGKNTRALMKGVTTLKGFENRLAKLTDDYCQSAQSNGSLMRCTPFILLSKDKWEEASDIDVSLTNNNDINRTCSKIYINLLRHIIYKEKINCYLQKGLEIKVYIKYALERKIINVSKNKGWVVYALYVTLITFFHTDTYQEGMNFIMENFASGDTDTLMAIAGGLMGAYYSLDDMKKDPKTAKNISTIRQVFAGETDRLYYQTIINFEDSI